MNEHPLNEFILHKLTEMAGDVRVPQCVIVPPVVARYFTLKAGEPVDEHVWTFLRRLEMMRDGRFPFFGRVGIELAMYGPMHRTYVAGFKP